MSISYKIKVNGSGADALTVDIGRIPCLALPTHITHSILPAIKKIARITEYMNALFTNDSKKTAEFRHVVATIVKGAKEKGTLNIVCTHKLAELHTKCFIKYLTDNGEMIDTLSPYILGTGYTVPEGSGEGSLIPTEDGQGVLVPVDSENPEAGNVMFKGEGLERLSADDLSQITKLMNVQAEQAASDNNADVTDVVAKEVVTEQVVFEAVETAKVDDTVQETSEVLKDETINEDAPKEEAGSALIEDAPKDDATVTDLPAVTVVDESFDTNKASDEELKAQENQDVHTDSEDNKTTTAVNVQDSMQKSKKNKHSN